MTGSFFGNEEAVILFDKELFMTLQQINYLLTIKK